jgi:putative peptidoglycan lipid II flippase
MLGFIRDMMIAQIFGVNWATDAFFAAFKLPNFLRRLFVEGAFANAFIPVLFHYKAQADGALLKSFINKTAGSLLAVLSLFTVFGILSAPLLMVLLAPGFAWQGEQHDLAVTCLEIILPYLVFIGFIAFSGSILNAHGKFLIPALTPAVLNIAMIAAAIWLAPMMKIPVAALAWGVIIAGLAQVLLQLPALMRLNLLPRLRVDLNDTGVKMVLRMMPPAIFSASVSQINLLLDTLMASFLTLGSVSWLYYSDRLVEFPIGILGLALSTVALPGLAKSHAANDVSAFSDALDWCLRLSVLIGLPATLGLLLLAEPMLSTLFQYKEFGADDVHLAGRSLQAYALGLLGFILSKLLVAGFTSRHDTQTPLRYGIYALLISLALHSTLIFLLAHAGLALATSLTAFVNALMLLKKLVQDKIYRPTTGWPSFVLRIILASAVMAAFLYASINVDWWQQWSSKQRAIELSKWIVLGFIVYASALVITGLRLRHLSPSHVRIKRFN